MLRLIAQSTCLSGLMMLSAAMVFGQDYPSKSVRIVTTAAGGGSGLLARIVAQTITGAMGQQFVVDNRSGTVIPGEIVAKSAPDGYTLLCMGTPLWLAPFLIDKTPYDPIRDFAPITLLATSPNVLVVHPSLPVTSVQQLIALAKAKPGQLNYASGPAGGSPQLAAELFKSMTGIKIIEIPYKGIGQAITAVVAGELQVIFPNVATIMPHVKAGRLRALAVTTFKPSSLAPGLPTVAASGLPGYESTGMFGMLAPVGTPPMVVQRLNLEIVRILNTEDVRQKVFNVGAETVGNSPAEFAGIIKADMSKLGKLIKDLGIRAE